MASDLQLFVRQALEQNISREKIKHALLQAGWQDDEIKNALAAYLDTDLPLPVPKRKPYLSAREAFLYLVMFLTLYISAFSIGTLLFQFVNRWIPDPTNVDNTYALQSLLSTVRSATAALIIAFPVFLFIAWRLNRDLTNDPEKRASKIRKWLTHITLFIAAGTIITDLIILLYNLLSGDLTLRFVLKVAAALVIAGAAFAYYLRDLRSRVFHWIVMVLALAVAVTGLFVAGSPSKERTRKLEEQRKYLYPPQPLSAPSTTLPSYDAL